MSFQAATVAVPSAGGSSAKGSAPGRAAPAVTPAAAAAAAAAAASAKRLESFAGTAGSLPDVSTPSARVTQEALLREGFVLHADMDKLHTDLCKAWAAGSGGSGGGSGRKERLLPLVCPSVEQYGAVVGLQLEEREPLPSAQEAAEAAEAAEGSSSSSSSSSSSGGAAQRSFQPPQPLRDRNAYLPYRWMFSPLHERSAALRDRLEEMVGALAGGAAVPLEAMTIGRICAEAEASRINTASVSLELARGGGMVKLDLREVPRFAVFPGQIVGVQGASTGVDRLAVSDLHTGGAAPYARMPMANAQALARVRSKGGPTRIWVAAGPFTDPKDMNFEPLQEFLAEATQAEAGQGPNVLVLQGPFVDAEHPMVKSTAPLALDDNSFMVPSTYKEVWYSVLKIIETYLTQPGAEGIEVVLQPSPGDAHADPVFPQWPMARESIVAEDEGFRARCTLLPNPASWVCGDLVWGGSSADIVFHLNSEEAGKVGAVAPGEARPDRFASLASHLLEQRSFYPLYPAHSGAGAAGGGSSSSEAAATAGAVPLEVTQLWHTGMPCSPDVLLLPSRLGRPCVRVVGGGTVVVNPGSLARNKAYAKVSVFPLTGLQEQAALGVTHVSAMAPSRVRVDIERIIMEAQ